MQGQIAVKGTLIITPKGSSDLKPEARVINKILQMDGEKIARELSAEHHLLVDGWGRNMFVPSLVYMPEKDRLLLSCLSRGNSVSDPIQAILIASDDHGQTWNNPIDRTMGQGNAAAPGMSLSYLGNGTLLGTGEGSGENTGWLSRDYGDTWVSFPSPHAVGGFTIYMWDPCLTDKDPVTRELKRTVRSGYRKGMGRQFEHARKLVVFPDAWHWKHDPEDRGLTEEWYKDEAFACWPRMMRSDKHWTLQGEPGGVGWYATNFDMPAAGDVPLLILFGAVDGYCDVFIDGKKVGEQKKSPEIMWDAPFRLSLDCGLSEGNHSMVIRVEKKCVEDTNAGIHAPIWIVDKSGLDTREKVVSCPSRHALIRFSYDGGRTWPEEIEPPSWNGSSGVGVNEVALCCAANGDLVAACRIEHPKYFGTSGDPMHEDGFIDHYCGLGVSLSKDNGYTWTNINVLYEYGRMQPSMVLMPDGDIVMTYVVRMGTLKEEHRLRDADGFSQWSIEAVVSHDHGASWDLAHRYVLAKWSGGSQSQSTSTVLLPDGSLLTAFGSGFLSQPVKENIAPAHEVCLVHWHPDSGYRSL